MRALAKLGVDVAHRKHKALCSAVAAPPMCHRAPIWLNAGLNDVAPRVEESGIGLIAGSAFSAPYEDVKLKSR